MYSAHALTVEQTGAHPEEAARLIAAHPDEPNVVQFGRVLGMAVSRAFGDARLKWTLAEQRELKRRQLRTRMLLQVHDELLFEAPDDEVEAVKALSRECMSAVMTLRIPLKVEVGAGNTWADAH